jgi:hypothetical protein
MEFAALDSRFRGNDGHRTETCSFSSFGHTQSKVSTVRATSPAFIARNASLMSPSRPRLVTMASRSRRPWRKKSVNDVQIAVAHAGGRGADQHLAAPRFVDVNSFDGQRLVDLAKDRGVDLHLSGPQEKLGTRQSVARSSALGKDRGTTVRTLGRYTENPSQG